MLKHCNNKDLLKLDIAEKHHLFYQAWKELTDRRTIGSYQYKIMNSISALQELYDVIGLRLDGSHSTNHNVIECKQETMGILRKDRVLAARFAPSYNQLLTHLGKAPKNDPDLRSLRYHIKYCYEIFSPSYLESYFEALESAIEQQNSKRIIEHTGVIISYCATLGWSTPALYEVVDCLRGSSSDESVWEKFRLKMTSSTTSCFTVCIPLNLKYKAKHDTKENFSKKVHELMRQMGLRVLNASETGDIFPHGTRKPLPDRYFMVCEINAFDSFAACYKAIDECSDVLNMLTFYNYIESWKDEVVSCWTLNSSSEEERTLRESDLFGSVSYMVSNQKVFGASASLMKRKETTLNSKLRAAFAYASMGKASGSQEERFMNSWVALESLCRSDSCDNIISCVLETVPPALCARYIYRLLRNFIDDCERCGIAWQSADPSLAFMQHAPQKERVKTLATALTNDENYHKLHEHCGVNRLLEHRCAQLHDLMADSQCLIDRIKSHCDTVRMQLSRLYRIRNSIAHTGRAGSDSLTHCIEHLDDYLIGFVSQVVATAEDCDEDEAEVVFEMIRDNYASFTDLASSAKSCDMRVMLKELFEEGIIALIPTKDMR